MSEQRAILVSREQRDAIDSARYQLQDDPYYDEHFEAFQASDDAAGDQPRIRWCAEHGRAASECPHAGTGEYTCRVVDAIVCVVES